MCGWGRGAEGSLGPLQPPAPLPSFKELEPFPPAALPHVPVSWVPVPLRHPSAPGAPEADELTSAGSSSPSPKALAEQGSLIIWVSF